MGLYSVLVVVYAPPPSHRDPKAVMKIETLNATFQPAKIGNPVACRLQSGKTTAAQGTSLFTSDAKLKLTRNFEGRLYGGRQGPKVSLPLPEAWVRPWWRCSSGSKENSYTVLLDGVRLTQGYH
ncbi:arf-GAP with dual PH domain-containing protein 1-like isoform X2 [Lates japonicus]|uniref:Arf-GAP with dual PH domain-containing protein 1-like isoform X2 n=1 Tax=Lates japonicus TaxID=270547 RepID=A0AAD3MP89_LATJO|nr:arf-GAP with dual PH domain-containing protein 1-like isoform X2 [Lates japonicus]